MRQSRLYKNDVEARGSVYCSMVLERDYFRGSTVAQRLFVDGVHSERLFQRDVGPGDDGRSWMLWVSK